MNQTPYQRLISAPTGMHVLEVHTDWTGDCDVIKYRRGEMYLAHYDGRKTHPWVLHPFAGRDYDHCMSSKWASEIFDRPLDLQFVSTPLPTTQEEYETEIACLEEWIDKIERRTTIEPLSDLARYRDSHRARQNYLKIKLKAEYNV